MSFITKRERVFNEYDLFDLPARNEGKLKAYASCTDARAWSHFCSDKSEHLVEIIKRNNEVCRPKYVPTEAIVNTLLAHKQAEIVRLKRKIEEFEQMVAAYDELELSCEQKCEIAKAHATIKEANKDLNELWFDLDLSGYTGIDSEDFETGKSRGDELSKVKSDLEEDEGDELGIETPRSKGSKGGGERERDEWISEKELPLKESKGNQAGETKCICDASTNVVDPRIQEMREVIITKDAKLNAMRNTYAVVENDACEPYCIYAHIYTALEKIFGILCQNDKYKLYLNLMTAGKDIRHIDIKGRILFKLKVLEKFSLALLAPCSRDTQNSQSAQDCSCYRAEIIPNIETAYALTSSEAHKPLHDTKRSQLVADIMENEEMKELLNKDSKTDTDDEDANVYNIDQENLKRLKNLQQNYDDLMDCYEALKHEKDCLQIRCRKYEEIETEFENLQTQLKEYNSLWKEKEHYRRRSLDLDVLKEQYLVLCDETTTLETELKAENEINDVKNKTIDELRSENIALARKLNDASIAFEKERNCAQCKLKETECKIMCQGQQIKSLSIQIDRLLEQESDKLQPKQSETTAIVLIDEINSLKEQIKNLQDALFCTEEENQQLQLEYQNKLNFINNLKMEIEDWKSNYEKTLQRNDYLEKCTNSFGDENKALSQDIEEKQQAIDNLINVLKNKSQDIDKLMEEMELKSKENSDLYAEISNLHDSYSKSITVLDSEKLHAMQSLQIAKKESQELLEKVKKYDDLVNKHEDISLFYQRQNEENNRLKALLTSTQHENETLQMDLTSRENNNSILLQEIHRLQEVNTSAVNNISALQDEKNHYKISLELTKKDSKVIEDRLHSLEDLPYKFQQLKESHEKLKQEKCKLESELANKTLELDSAIQNIVLKKKESDELEVKLKSNEHIKTDFESVDSAYKKLVKEQQRLQKELDEKKRGFNSLLESYNNLQNNMERINNQSSEEISSLSREIFSLKNFYNELFTEKNALQNDYDRKNEEINNLRNNLERKIVENKALSEQIQILELNNITVQDNINILQEEQYSTSNVLNSLRKESEELMDRVQFYENLESNYDKLKREHEQMKGENYKLQNELDTQRAKLRKIAEDNDALHSESQHLLSHSEDLEKALINARTELIGMSGSPNNLHKDIIKQIDEMKIEKNKNTMKIRDLYNKLDESDYIISDLRENILARDDKIAILENHINELQDEVKRLHRSLAEMVETGEQIKDISHQKITDSLDTMEAHHSKATHNMKMELAKLQSDKIRLEENLSISKIKSEDSARDKHKYISQIIHLQNEREIIVTDIKQLELRSVGDSALSPEHCNVEDILGSLDRIRRYVDVRSSKSSSLEQTLLKVQNSYQVVQNKADEAKKIVEKEKHKILSEKEDAIRDRINMEKQLTGLREQLEKQISHDKGIIKDLEAEILNQKLIYDKLNTSTQNYVSKLKDEMQSLQELYQKSIDKISNLEKRLQLMSDEKNTHSNIIEKVNNKLQEKLKEIDLLKKDLESIKNKPSQTLGTQASVVKNRDSETQTFEEFLYEGYDQYKNTNKEKNKDENRDHDSIHSEKSVALERKTSHIEQHKRVNEIQVLVANVEPTFDYVRNSYLNYKLKNLRPGRLEQYSISCTSENDTELDTKEITEPDINKSGEGFMKSQSNENMNVIDIYNKQSIHTNSSKNIESNYPENKRDPRSPGITSAITDFGLTVESFDTKNSMNRASNLFGSVSGISTDKDLFVIYKDSETNKYDKKTWVEIKHSEILVEAISIHPDRYDVKGNLKQNDVDNDTYSYLEDDELLEDDSVKNKLNINLPRVETDSPTIDISSDSEKKSFDSYNINSISNDETKFLESYFSNEDEKHIALKKQKRNQTNFNESITRDPSAIQNIVKKDSHHRLSRTDADVRLIRSKTGHTGEKNSAGSKSSNHEKPASHFGLDYIHATADNIKTYDAAAALRKTRSDELFGPIIFHRKTDSIPSKLSEANNISTDYKTVPANAQSSYIIQTNRKKYTDQEVLVKLDPIDEYEMQIKNLTNNLENIEKDYKKKIDAIKIQYDSNIKSILNEHNEGVKSIQGLHEETLQDIIRHHENEVENLRSMSIEAMRKADKLEKEVRSLKHQMPVCSATCLNEEPIKISSELVKRRQSRIDTKTLTKTNVEAFNVRPKSRSSGPCTCSLDINISDTIRNIFEQVDVDQRKIAEQTYLKYIANKILNGTVEALDCQELSFLHLKVCRIWKVKLTKEETLQRRISSLEAEVIHKQRHNQHNIAELDRQVAEERRRLQEAREAVCRNAPTASRYSSRDSPSHGLTVLSNNVEVDRLCGCNTGPSGVINLNFDERKSAGDLGPSPSNGPRQKRNKPETNRAVLAKLDAEDRREKKLYHDEPPTRLRRPHDRDRHLARPAKK